MCAISGIVRAERAVVDQTIPNMVRVQSHRGPDGEGTCVLPFGAGWLGLGHCRLAILDLSPLASQPMTSPEGNWLSFNGEIYNFASLRRELTALGHTFRGSGDTEVLLAALNQWGADALQKLNGMFALAYFDTTEGRLLVARDPTGMKPLYLAEQDGGLVFASEVRAILTSGVSATLDMTGAAGFLAFGAVQHPSTLFRGIRSLPAGCYQEYEPAVGGGVAALGPPTPFWVYPAADAACSTREVVEQVRTVVDAAVRDHLVSEVPVGVFLSAGIDSTVISGLAARHRPDLTAFTLAFSGDPEFDESSLASKSARRFGLRHEVITLCPKGAEQAAVAWLAGLDQPSIDGLNVFIISQAVRARGIKVALSGQGGDELFGGYPSFRDLDRIRRLATALRHLPSFLRRGVAKALTLSRSSSVQAKFSDMIGGSSDLVSLYLHRRRLLSDPQMRSLGIEASDLNLPPHFMPSAALPSLDDPADTVASVSRLESACYQGNTLLRDSDTNGMAFGLEIRPPLLDRRVIELAHSLPGHLRLPSGSPSKYLLRQAFPDLLSTEALARPKSGFTLPIRRWLNSSLKDWFITCVDALKRNTHFCPKGIDAIVNDFHRKPESQHWSRAFALAVLGDFVLRHGGR